MTVEIIFGIASILFLLILNVVGWAFTYGRLSQKVDNLDGTLKNGLTSKVDGMSKCLATLQGEFNSVKELLDKVVEGKIGG